MEKMRHTAMTRASDSFDRRSRIVVTCTAASERTSSHKDVVSLPSADWFLEWSALCEFAIWMRSGENAAREKGR